MHAKSTKPLRLMSVIKQLAPPIVWDKLRKIRIYFNRAAKDSKTQSSPQNIDEDTRLKSLERYVCTETKFLDHPIKIVDNASYMSLKNELFGKQIYRFNCDSEQPCIVDCGANIGMSIIYFKQLFPGAEITGFEPDKKIFQVLKYNVESFQLSKVTLIEKACWNEETTLRFYSEGADAGRTATDGDNGNITEVKTIRLRNFLNRKVNFLKIDIEGAELNVLKDCSDLLINVENIFVEYHSFVDTQQFLPEILTILKDAGFRLHISAPTLVSQTPFTELRTYANMDNLLNIYGSRDFRLKANFE